MRTNYVLLLCFAALMACTKEKVQTTPTTGITTKDLDGEWTWISSSGGIAGKTYTPDNSTKSMKLTFAGNKVSSIVNTAPKGSMTFSIS
jgi:hypothetical protein